MAGEEPRHRVIQKDYTDTPAFDYTFLRRKAIELIQKFSGQNWTDFNIHDPGITILELVCYAITDLAYRTGFPITDLLADENGIIDKRSHSFVPGNLILSAAPLSMNDFRKLLIDKVTEINNVWLEPVGSSFASNHSRGAYRVIIQADAWKQQEADTEEKKKGLEETIIQKVKSILSGYRNISEDFTEFIVLQPQKIEVAAQIVIRKNAVSEELLAEVYFRIEQALNPHTVFFAEQELLTQGVRIEDIYKGPLLKQGIIPDSELKDILKEVDKSNLIKPVSDMTDVIHIRLFQLKDEDADHYTNEPVVLKERHYPLLYFNPSSPDITLYYDNLPVPVKAPVFYRMLQRLHDTFHKAFITDVHNANTQGKEEGMYRNVQEYVSLQNLFPAVYRIGSEGIEDSASPLRKAQAKQLKAYLLFFEQILAGYASQLGNLTHLFSPDVQSSPAHTFFFQPLYAVPGIAPLLSAFTGPQNMLWDAFMEDKENDYIKGLRKLTESGETYNNRKNKVFDHLLSRFNIVPDNYPVILYRQLYTSYDEKEPAYEELKWKSALLSQIQAFTYYRMRADNYHQQNVDTILPGFTFNMRLLLHIQSRETRLSNAVTSYIDHGKTNTTSAPALSSQKIETIIYNDEELDVIKEDDNQDLSSFRFPHRTVKFFEWAVDKSNYRTVPDGDKTGQLVLYKNMAEKQWHIIRRYADRQTAQEGINQLIKKLIDVSIQSEGFYVVEHLLLAPPHNANVFGFTFYDKAGKLLLQQARWMSFQQREETIQQIMDVVVSTNEGTSLERFVRLKNLCKIAVQNSGSEVRYMHPDALLYIEENELSKLWLHLQSSLQLFGANRANYYPAFHYTVLHWDGNIMEETFYDNCVTIVLPSWPLRFQHEGFRQFAEDAFRGNLPVHINVGFLWLNISKMTRFEDMFFDWGDALRNDNPDVKRMESILLIPFLQKELKRAKP